MDIEEYRRIFPTAKRKPKLLPLHLEGVKCRLCGCDRHRRKPNGKFWRCTECNAKTPIWEIGMERHRIDIRKPVAVPKEPIHLNQVNWVDVRKTASFIRKARRTHGKRFGYPGTAFVTEKTATVVRCRKHGPFWVEPKIHLSHPDGGCEKCSQERKTAEFVEKARKVHGDRYGYDHTVYVKCVEKVYITCPLHGDFRQVPNSHLRGRGCPKCAHEAMRLDNDTLLSELREIHGDRYEYPNLGERKNGMIEIVCPTHGSFFQTPHVHLNGVGCPKCLYESKRLKTEEFVEKARKVHGNMYSYDGTEYTLTHEKVTITCPVHGDFRQRPSAHLQGHGCPECGGGGGQKLTTERFVEKAKGVHGDKYDYSWTNYMNSMTYVDIICPKHGAYRQTPHSHLLGYGCPDCGREKAIAATREHYAKMRKRKRKTTRPRKRNKQ